MRISQRIGAARPLATTAMHGRVEALRAAGESRIYFSIANSHFPAPACVRERVAAALAGPALPYTAVGGAIGVRACMARKVNQDNRIDAQPEEIILTNGAKQALYEALYVLTDPGDTILVFRPHWPAYLATAELLKLNVVVADLPARFTDEVLASLPPARLIIINNPHNPTGQVMARADMQRLGAWMRQRGCHAIVDESYEKLIFTGEHHSLASCADWRALGIVTLFSASQSYAMMGWRCGFAVAPAHVVQAMETLQGPITAAASALSQVATEAAFQSGEPSAMLEDYRRRRDLVIGLFADVPWIRMASPDSGPYLWGDVSALQVDTVQFAEALLAEHRVAIMPGDALGQPGYIRLGYISDDVETLTRGVAAIIAFGNTLASR
jgi:aspartate aminotransferase